MPRRSRCLHRITTRLTVTGKTLLPPMKVSIRASPSFHSCTGLFSDRNNLCFSLCSAQDFTDGCRYRRSHPERSVDPAERQRRDECSGFYSFDHDLGSALTVEKMDSIPVRDWQTTHVNESRSRRRRVVCSAISTVTTDLTFGNRRQQRSSRIFPADAMESILQATVSDRLASPVNGLRLNTTIH